MTSDAISHQGEGSGGGVCRPHRPKAVRWTSNPMVPEQCVKLELVLHTAPNERVACVAFELSNPHTKELLSKWVDPARKFGTATGLVTGALVDCRSLLFDLLDPDPF